MLLQARMTGARVAHQGDRELDKKDLLIEEFVRGKVSRRDFQAGVMGMGISAAAASALLAQSIARAEAAEPVAGGRIVAAADASHAGDTLDPAKIVGSIDISRASSWAAG